MTAAYRLEAPRPRKLPSNLHLQSSLISSSVLSSQPSDTFLYDLPSPPAFPSSPPSSPRKNGRIMSPSRRTPGRPTPPTTPSGARPNELEVFSEHCRAWYFSQDDESGRIMTQTLSNLPPSQRAPFARLQASVRSAYHHSMKMQKNAEFQAHLAATLPGGSLMPLSRSNPREPAAKKERSEKLERFLRSWCTLGLPGTIPFFEALWAILRIQTISPSVGGAGAYRMCWELDDAVFKEAGGKNFMLEAIDILKGVLAFEERLSSRPSSVLRNFDSYTVAHSRSYSQPLPQQIETSSASIQAKRSRAPSDPFLDRIPPLSRSIGSASSGSTITPLPTLGFKNEEQLPSPVAQDRDNLLTGSPCDDSDEEYLRIWTCPDLADAEFSELSKLFPSFITRKPLPRFRAVQTRDLEDIDEEDRIRFGTGTMFISRQRRMAGLESSWWTNFCRWWAQLFC